MRLIIVESPTKAKTISRFLGKTDIVESSFGHVRDLPTKKMGIAIDNNFEPSYEIPTKAKKTVNKLKALAKQADEIVLASDGDREGEAIAWHLQQLLKLPPKDTNRIVFHEITESAIKTALKNPRQLNQNLIDAQQARRVLDRLVGYELSPFLWKKVAKNLSAGRVQSVAVRLIVEREREIENFQQQEYWTINADLQAKDGQFSAQLARWQDKSLDKLTLSNETLANEIKNKLLNAQYTISSITKNRLTKKPAAPFTTSTLQQTANRWFGFSAKQTMVIAQQLYEGINLGPHGQTGLITYMRTDAVNLSNDFIAQSREVLQNNFGPQFLSPSPRKFANKSKGAQEAHEAIRPTDPQRTPESIKSYLEPRQLKLYQLIWQRALASQAAEAQIDHITVDIAAGEGLFRATGQTIAFPGYLMIYPEQTQEKLLPSLTANEILQLLNLQTEQHFTQPPARYSDAGLVKQLEKHGIGRPSTYAPIIATIEARNYVIRDEHKRLEPTAIAKVVNDLLVAHFPAIVDYQFTANIEERLDQIARGHLNWQPVIADFYQPFHQNLEIKNKQLSRQDILPDQASTEVCDKCGAPMVIKTSRYGPFLACSAFPKCRNIKSMKEKKVSKPLPEKFQHLLTKYADQVCDKCGAPMAVKVGRYGPFLACSAFPKCRNLQKIIVKTAAATTAVKKNKKSKKI
ncbi:MAG TPA: type I DNA topoisomerase [bacterium]|jgi:DNA topoisomerase-1|nr:type I DNA topoisomerase [bacterium]HOQ91410.1 type I DNA topoisomerase [bacterium]HPL22247.1 type I DNA topoisomerase [bacterium]HPX63906.1 type I DNA topoisomerase [bacterium]HQA84185.1 type I DNA topoisomerase [bacterium]